jgi:aminopeptidase N
VPRVRVTVEGTKTTKSAFYPTLQSETKSNSYITLDSLQSSHPISVPVNHPDEINEIFDSISYGKGASVIRMMANFLGLETFNGGITNYLNMHKYGNAKQVSS